ncbi:MAG: signal peptide peptidase SppA [Planctomycetes bacterium]|nr:signal peptide peptidase SppA [Planctomycetota bacterium]
MNDGPLPNSYSTGPSSPQGPLPPGAPLPQGSWPPPPPPAAAPQRRGFSIGSCLVTLFLLGSLGLNLVLVFALMASLGGGGMGADTTFERTVAGEPKAEKKIVVIPVHGVITAGSTSSFLGSTGDMVEKIIHDLRRAKADDSVVAVILDVDSPGGGISDCDRIHGEIMEFRRAKPKVAFLSFMRDVAASGGYYVSAPCDEIVAMPTTITGSIGVIMSFMNLQGLFEKIGVRQEVIKSGDHKDIGSMSRPMTDEERAMLQSILMEMYDRFVKVVADGRKMDEKKVRILADGRIYSALQAKANGLVDSLGSYEFAIDEAKRLAKTPAANVIEYQRPPGLADLIRGETKAASPEAAAAASIERLVGHRDGFYYLWTAGGNR